MSTDQHQNRQPAGVPTGGQFAASVRAEATVHLTASGNDVDFAPATGPADTFLDSDQYAEFVDATLTRAEQAMRTEQRDDSSAGYHEGQAMADAQAFWLLQRRYVPPVHEVAWEANEFTDQMLHPETGKISGANARRNFITGLGPYEPMSTEHAAAIADHFLVMAVSAADTVQAAGPTNINGLPNRASGALRGACTNAIRFRTGNPDPDPGQVTALEHAMQDRARERSQIIRCGFPTAEEGRDVYTEVFDPYAGVDFTVDA